MRRVAGAPNSAPCPTISTTTCRRPLLGSADRQDTTSRSGVSWTTGRKAIPISEAELDLFDTHFGDLLDELFGAKRA